MQYLWALIRRFHFRLQTPLRPARPKSQSERTVQTLSRQCLFSSQVFNLSFAVIDDSVTISKSFFCEAEILREFAYFTRLLSFHFFSRVAFWCSFARTRAFGSAIPVQSTLNLRVNYNSHIIAPAHGWKMSTSDSHWGSTFWPKEDTHHLQGPNVFLLQKALESGGML